MEVIARFSHDKIDHTKSNTPNLVLSLRAPTMDWVTKRPNLCVLAAVDLSGSMDEDNKLVYAKKSLHKLVDQLLPGDVFGIVTFAGQALVAVKPQTVTADFKTKLHNAIDKLAAYGGTNLCGGIQESLRQVEGLDLGPQYLKRIILFTDGEPTNGITDKDAIVKQMTDNLGTATISAFGYGMVSQSKNVHGLRGCDPEFMSRISQEGKGNYAYVQNTDDALTAFGRELGGLLSTYAQDIKVFIDPQSGHQVTKVITDIKTKADPLGEISFEVPEILSEETRDFVFDTSIAAQHKAFPRQFTIFNVKVSYSVLTEKGDQETKTIETKAKLRFVEPGEEDKAIVPELNETIALAQVVRAQLEAEEKCKAGDWAGAQAIMTTTSNQVRSRGLGRTAKLAESVGARLGNAAAYADGGGYLRSVSAAVTRSYGTSSLHREAAEDLSFMAMSNSSMAMYENSFKDPEPTVHIPSVWTPNPAPIAPPVVNPSGLDLSKLWVPEHSVIATTHETKPGETLVWATTTSTGDAEPDPDPQP